MSDLSVSVLVLAGAVFVSAIHVSGAISDAIREAGKTLENLLQTEFEKEGEYYKESKEWQDDYNEAMKTPPYDYLFREPPDPPGIVGVAQNLRFVSGYLAHLPRLVEAVEKLAATKLG